jgi:hypothetical protein
MSERYATQRRLNEAIAKMALGAGGVGLAVLLVILAL